ncbi:MULTISPECIES: hypothetical protein [Methylobacterium]|uniref:Uncharacterized protein n=2 Tax=Pseudomonadota TaxID=1224 RepID=A0ABQ4SZ38_9HYPH|nr:MULTISPECIES: hypothetical protein [Methylobacterium]PIU08360.1 MAG: hypothetical protein COT56_01650 [Methylobacterium sp. CG09_land_8_20_14_0_10_71_15]PIU13541.1 MAG: hypothetical protein COT28_11055 [Methylobacterium sp. CG08_land_8_20_14_0_20_71_15]GBU18728.1 hypothetical protein AwMethylo_29430 [Methylobacterium sp.]GJE07765.1 hypothetical protein AOPFMNJM_3095 [Methylobacterium jeotgali]
MTVPVYPWTVWIVAALDPILIGLALYLGYTASQFGKVFIAAIIALAVSVLASWAITAVGIPWPAPISHDGPTFFPVRLVGAFLWALVGYGARRVLARRA